MGSTGLWRLVVSGAIAMCFALAGWTLSSIADMPKEYTSKEEFQQLRKENREDHKEIIREIKALHTGN
jgi:hypothetical protein